MKALVFGFEDYGGRQATDEEIEQFGETDKIFTFEKAGTEYTVIKRENPTRLMIEAIEADIEGIKEDTGLEIETVVLSVE